MIYKNSTLIHTAINILIFKAMLTIIKALYNEHFGMPEYHACVLGLEHTGKTVIF
jgi:hypothetical protein